MIFIPITPYSPRDTWKMVANIIIAHKPKAAQIVNLGFIFKAIGNINPTPPRSSETPINRTSAAEDSATHGRDLANSFIG